ncbi:30S ribosomal protein S26e [Candidatus Bathyarchaeota archaeon]|nr:30S ribosomal protein S26e [Candidatus Bathyarchaeota archaeon]
MPYKRKSHGRSKGSKGSGGFVQCVSCGATVPRDKAKKVTKRVSVVGGPLAKELRQKGAYITAPRVTKYYCVSCAVHRGVVKVRAKDERHSRPRRRRRR